MATKSEINCVRMAYEALSGLSGEKAVHTIYMLACDHPRISAEDLDKLANRLGRAAHEKARLT